MVHQQRAAAALLDAVVEGRDIGTVVFPDADVKVFLTASADERARRRRIDLAGTGHAVTHDTVRETLERRDHADSTRPVAPLGQAADAVPLDTTGLSVDDVVDAICALVEARR
jgi:cytidylate kinase